MRIILSLIFLVVIAAVWIFDSYALMRGYPDHTVSNVVVEWSSHYPIIPLLVGVVIGHVFWPAR